MMAISPGRSRFVRFLVRRSSRTRPPTSVGAPRRRSSVGSLVVLNILIGLVARARRCFLLLFSHPSRSASCRRRRSSRTEERGPLIAPPIDSGAHLAMLEEPRPDFTPNLSVRATRGGGQLDQLAGVGQGRVGCLEAG